MLRFIQIWTILSSQFIATKKTSVGIAVIPMIFAFYFHYDIAFTPLVYAYPTEIFPYSLRGVGVTLTYLTGHLGLIISLFVNPIALKNIAWRYYILFCVLNAVLSLIVYLLFPETKGHSLEEIAVVFEGKKVAANKAMSEKLESDNRKGDSHGSHKEVEIV
jgi:MFS family permease